MFAYTDTPAVSEGLTILMVGSLRTLLGLVDIIANAANSSLISLCLSKTNPPFLHCNVCVTVNLLLYPLHFFGRLSIPNLYLILNPALNSSFDSDSSFMTVGIIESQAPVSVLCSTFLCRSLSISFLSSSRVLVWLESMLAWAIVFVPS